ncbi:MAG: hypothetical protein JSV85_06905 [Candidatus Bathyarchaeota archaeon]|nr:MAG: hypothetical protein JSV85_06905 [Candidatus Bathyarchaeota archaeon]
MIKFRTIIPTLMLLHMFGASIIPLAQTSSETYGPRLDQINGFFINTLESQAANFKSGDVDIWFDINDPVWARDLVDEGFTTHTARETFLFDYIAFNMRDQENPSGGGVPWRTESTPGDYYTYSGLQYENYVPLNDTAFRHALAHCIPKDEIVATVYGGISGAAISSVVPEAQRAWFKPGVDGHPFNPGDPTANTTYPDFHDACSILRAAGYVWGNATAPNPAPKCDPNDPDGNWLDPHLHAAVDDPNTPWDDTSMMPMNHITFTGVTEPSFPGFYGRDSICARKFRAIGLPIQHGPVSCPYIFAMMNHHQFDMYALEWKVGRFPDHLYGFFHSSQDMIGGYNFPGINDTELDAKLESVQFSLDRATVKQACFDAQDMVAEKLPYIVTFTRPLFNAFATAGAAYHTDTLRGIVDSPIYGAENDYMFYNLHWESNIDETTNPYGIGGTANMIVGSAPRNYHPGYASTVNEWKILGRIFDGLINIDPYTHEDIPWLATSWTVEDWDYGGSELGMNTTFWLRDDVYYHDGAKFNASVVEFSLEFARDQQIARARPMWRNLVDVEVHNTTSVSVYHNVTSLWIFYHTAGPEVWLVNDAACWATMFPKHIYEGTGPAFRPELIINPINSSLTYLIGTGPYVFRAGGELKLGGFAELTAYRVGSSPVTTHWWQSVEGSFNLTRDCFHWVGDCNRDGVVDITDLNKIGKAYAQVIGQPLYDPEADVGPEDPYHTNDGRVDIQDIVEVSRSWGKQRTYP